MLVQTSVAHTVALRGPHWKSILRWRRLSDGPAVFWESRLYKPGIGPDGGAILKALLPIWGTSPEELSRIRPVGCGSGDSAEWRLTRVRWCRVVLFCSKFPVFRSRLVSSSFIWWQRVG